MLRLSRTQLLLVALASSLPLTPASSQARTSAAGARAMMEAVNKRYFDLFNKGDVAAFAKVYSTDAWQLPPNAPVIRGREAIQQAWQRGWDAGVRNLRVNVVEASVHGNEATEVATWELDLVSPQGDKIGTDRGKVVVLWRRDARGEWHWHRDIYSSDLPAQPMMPAAARAAEGDSVWVVVQTVKPDRRSHVDEFVRTFWNAGLTAPDPKTREVFAKTRVLVPTAPNPDSSWTYAFIMDPLVTGGDYSIDRIAAKLFGTADGAQVAALFWGSLVGNQTGYRLTQATRQALGTP